jgi:hypothetical protein
MGAYKVTNNDEYICDSSSDREGLTPVGVGARAIELDSGQRYIWNGARWVEDLTLYAAFRAALEDVS